MARANIDLPAGGRPDIEPLDEALIVGNYYFADRRVDHQRAARRLFQVPRAVDREPVEYRVEAPPADGQFLVRKALKQWRLFQAGGVDRANAQDRAGLAKIGADIVRADRPAAC